MINLEEFMNKPLDATELKALEAAFPVTELKLTRRQKLERFAELVEKSQRECGLMHGLEYYTDYQLSTTGTAGTALNLVVTDDVFAKDGLKGRTVKDVRDYLELTTPDLHEFSCDCGGSISNAKQAERIRNLAGPDISVQQPTAGLGIGPIAMGTAFGLGIAFILTLPLLFA